MRVEYHRHSGRLHRARPQQAGRVLDRLLHHAGQVQLFHIAAVGKRKPGLHLGVLLRNGLENAVCDGTREGGLQSAAVHDLDLSRAVAVHRVADPPYPGVERRCPALHFERELDLPLRLDPAQGRRREARQWIGWLGYGQNVRLVGMVIPPVEKRIVHQAVEGVGLGLRGIGKTNPVLAKRAKPDAAAFGGDEGLDLTVVHANRKFRSPREIDLGILRAELFAAFEDALADWIH